MSTPARDAQRVCDTLARDYLQTYQVPALAVGALSAGAVVCREGYGTTRVQGTQAATSQTLFHMASVTKPFVATAVMQLVEAGSVQLDCPFIQYVPRFRLADPRGSAITVRHLLTHTAGLPDVQDFHWDQPEYDDGALDRYLDTLASTALLWEPGTRFSYSDIGFNILGALIANVTGRPFEEVLAQRILTPLGMSSSSLLFAQVDRERLAHPHVLDEQGLVQMLPVFPYNRCHAGSSTLYSTVDDMLRWCAVNLAGGELDGYRMVRPETHALMWTGTIGDIHPAFPRNGRIGLSWFTCRRRQLRIVGHMGQDDGFASVLLLVPERGVAVITMANRSYDYAQQGLWHLQFALIDQLCG